MQTTLKKKMFEFVDSTYDDQDATRFLNIGMLILISLNVIAAILETEAPCTHATKYFSMSLRHCR